MRSPLAFALGTTLVLVAATLIATVSIADAVEDVESLRRANAAQAAREAVVTRAHGYVVLLDGAEGLYAASQLVERDEWSSYVGAVIEHGDDRSFVTVGVVWWVEPDERAAFEAAVRNDTSLTAEGFPDFTISPPPVGPAAVILYAEPRRENDVGFDVLTSPVLREAVELARDQDALVASSPLRVAGLGDDVVFLFHAIHARDVPFDDLEDRRAAFQGAAYVTWQMSDLVASVPVPEGHRLEVEDVGAATAEAATLPEDVIVVGGRLWRIRYDVASSMLTPVERSAPGFTLAAGLGLSGLLGLVVFSFATLRRRAQDLADRMTADLAASEERFRSLADTMEDVVWMTTADLGRLLYANPAFERVWGVPRSYMEADAMWFLAKVHPDDVAHVREELDRLVAGLGDRHFEFRLVRADGAERTLVCRAFNVRDAHGAVVRRVVRVHDMTDARRTAAEREESGRRDVENAALRAKNEARAQLLNAVMHELNNPMTPLTLQVYLLRTTDLGPLTTKQVRALDVLDRNLARLTHIIHDVKDVARLESGKVKMRVQDADLARVVREAVEAFAPAFVEAGLVLEVDVGEDLDARFDADRVTQVIYNLLSNAVKYSPPRSEVRVGAHLEDGVVRVEVSDAGPGLTRAQMQDLFQAFGQVHEGDAQKEGTGLGLFLSKGFVEQLGGSMGAESAGPGLGTTFWFTLPRIERGVSA